MQQYKIRVNGVEEIRKKMLFIGMPLMIISLLVGFIIPFGGTEINLKEQLPTLVILIFTLGYSVLTVMKKQKALFESYLLTIESNGTLTRTQLNTPLITIPAVEISDIIKAKNGAFTVKGKNSIEVIGIPAQIENYAALESRLAEIRPLTIQTTVPIVQRTLIPIVLFVTGLMATLYLSNNKLIVAISGTLLLILMIGSFVLMQRSKNVDKQTKQSMYFVIGVLLFIIGQMYFKLTAP